MTQLIARGLAKESTPVFGAQLGRRLRKAREEKKMSLREMARRAEVSPSFISQVELGRASPSVGTLYAIVSVLGLSLDSLMQDEQALGSAPGHGSPSVPALAENLTDAALNHPEVEPRSAVAPQPQVGNLPGLQRHNERPELFLNGGVRWERLTPSDDPSVQFLRVTYGPAAESCPVNKLMTHAGKEYIHVLSGQLEVQVAFARQALGPGDSLNFDSTTPHRLSNPFEQDCIALWVVVGQDS